MRLLRRFILIGLVAALALLTGRAFAIEQATIVQVNDVSIFRNLLETGDFLVLAEYRIEYTTLPSEHAGEAYIVRLLDGTTEKARNTPYPFNDIGYGYGVVSMYLSAAEFTSSALTWGTSGYTVRLEGNPGLTFTGGPQGYDETIAAGDYSTGSTAATNIAQLGTEVIAIATVLQQQWQITMLTEAGNRIATGNATSYFTLAIPGLRSMAPDIFEVTTTAPTFTDDVHPSTLANTSRDRYNAVTFLNPAFNSLADDMNLPHGLIQSLLVAVGILTLVVVGLKLGGGQGAVLGLGMGIIIIIPTAMWAGLIGWAAGALALGIIAVLAVLRVARDWVGA